MDGLVLHWVSGCVHDSEGFQLISTLARVRTWAWSWVQS